MPTASPDFASLHRVLVTKLRHHGDVLLSSPVFSVLKNQYPHLQVDALVYGETRDMLSLHPAIDQVFTIDRSWRRAGLRTQLREETRLLQALRRQRYDVLIHLTESWRGVMLARTLGARLCVAGRYGHKRGRLWTSSFTHLYPIVHPRHTVEQNLDALRRMGIQPGDDERRLVLVPGEEAELSVDELLAEQELTSGSFIHVHPTSRWLFKCWREDRVAELINALCERGEQVVLTAAPDRKEMAMVDRITARVTHPIADLSGRLSLKQVAALSARAKCFVGVDTAPMHMAAAMQTPVVALFGPSSELLWGPWQVARRVITTDHSCRPCGRDGCGGSKVSECLTTIPVERVLDAVEQLCTEAQNR
ncbi:MAG: putative lipopolysaccharide heptosyltransferase III [Gammaproteobacteria bacterium]